jgi:hypothetical protein
MSLVETAHGFTGALFLLIHHLGRVKLVSYNPLYLFGLMPHSRDVFLTHHTVESGCNTTMLSTLLGSTDLARDA